ncbi:LysR family transcriptional regulator [Nocardioides sp. LHD-245]|uniref:LysR family transcriptional regulator n=1 Tax=Nocardioides sp. LHD-245 TaxID=3051387 RepID=UPI0027DF5DDD|nr:LysR family transcriptional regulator [Nocardioides sp. LHD-245]
MTPELDLETLRLLIAIDEHGSLNAAARECGLSQPAATVRVRAFEARWRLSAIQRSPRGSTLTTDGRAIISWARGVLHAVDQMRTSLRALSADSADELKVAASLTIAEFILPRWLGELHVRTPDLKPRLQVVNSDTVVALVRSGAADVGFIEAAGRPLGVSRRVIGSDRLVVVVNPTHTWARYQMPVSTESLRQARWIVREVGSGTRSTFESALRMQPRVALEAASTTALVGAALAGVGPAVVSARAVESELESGRLVAVATQLDLLRPLTAIWPDQRMSEATRDLLRIAAASTAPPHD